MPIVWYTVYRIKKERATEMMMVFKIVFTSVESGNPCVKFAKTLPIAQNFVAVYKKAGKGKDFKIIPIKLK